MVKRQGRPSPLGFTINRDGSILKDELIITALKEYRSSIEKYRSSIEFANGGGADHMLTIRSDNGPLDVKSQI